MKWVYLVGLALNTFGYIQFMRMLRQIDYTPALTKLKTASEIGGLLSLAIGFAVFQWWVPIIGVVLAPAVVGLVFSILGIARFPQIAILVGLPLSFFALAIA